MCVLSKITYCNIHTTNNTEKARGPVVGPYFFIYEYSCVCVQSVLYVVVKLKTLGVRAPEPPQVAPWNGDCDQT